MVKGCQRKMIVVQNTGSRYFETAYFILKSDIPPTSSERDMVNEAQTIVDACSVERFLQSRAQHETAPRENRGKRPKERRYDSIVAFFSGAATVGLVAAAVSIIANLLY